jgi:hypothetical protein
MSDAPNNRLVRWVVWSVWAAMTLAALVFVARFGSNVPFWDEWAMVDVLTGSQPVNLQWLWSAHNGHRIPLPRLVLLGLYKISGADFRVGMYFNVAILSAAAAALIWASWRIRGRRMSVVDAVFPVLLLHWGHYENLLWSWQVTQVLPTVVACMVLAVIAVHGLIPSRTGLLAATGIVTLPLSGFPGLAYAPALALWPAIMGAVAFRHGRRAYAVGVWATTVLTLTLAALYFQHYNYGPLTVVESRGVIRTAVRFMAGGLGPAVRDVSTAVRAALLALLFSTGAALGWAAWRDQSPHRARGLLLFFAGAACLVMAFAGGRTGVGIVGRYVTLATPLWSAAILAWPVCARPRVGSLIQAALLTFVIAIAPLNFRAGLLYARDYHERMERFRADMRAGMPPGELVARHGASLCPCPWRGFDDVGVKRLSGNFDSNDDGFPAMNVVSGHDWMPRRLRGLCAAKIGDYARMRSDDPPCREIMPSSASGFAMDRALGTTGKARLENSAVLITPERPMYLIGVRIRRPSESPYVLPGKAQGRWVQLLWRSPGEDAYIPPNHYVFYWEPGQDEQIVWIFRAIDQIAFHMADYDVGRQLGSGELPLTVLLPVESYAR